MYAIIKTGGKQYRVSEGDEVFVEKLGLEAGEKVSFDQVLAMGEGEALEWGKPYLEGAKVEAEIVKNGKGPKINIFKYKAKKGYRRRQGHRQPYSKVKITSLAR
ncbi:MAG: 50S ribosomal protein L21 [Eubacteriales bacterium]|nr:50S ribosomal protein L21 [Clostridiales bacterium]MDY5836983.1 50S ribosomal protein L21 [Eubacteriales bacterium]